MVKDIAGSFVVDSIETSALKGQLFNVDTKRGEDWENQAPIIST